MLIRDNHGVTGPAHIVFRSLVGAALDVGQVPTHLAAEGIVLFAQADRLTLTHALTSWAVARTHPHADRSAFTAVQPRTSVAGPGAAGFSHARLAPHTDRALTSRPPSLIALLIEQAAHDGGQSLLVDIRPTAIGAGCSASALTLGSADAGRWPILEINAEMARARFRDDAMARPQALDPHGHKILDQIRKLTSTPTVLSLKAGEGYLLHNHRILHGRTSFAGDRLAARLLADIRPGHEFAWLNEGFTI